MTEEVEIKLTRKQKVFIEEYLQTWNATRAAEKAGYKHPRQQGSYLLSNLNNIIQERIKEKAMDADEVLARIAEQATVSLSDFIDFEEEDGRQQIKGINWEEVQKRGHLVKSIAPTQSGIKLELHDGQTALLTLAKHHGLAIERHDVTSGGKELRLHDERFDRAISTLADAIGKALSPALPGEAGAVDAAEQPTVAGAAVEGR